MTPELVLVVVKTLMPSSAPNNDAHDRKRRTNIFIVATRSDGQKLSRRHRSGTQKCNGDNRVSWLGRTDRRGADWLQCCVRPTIRGRQKSLRMLLHISHLVVVKLNHLLNRITHGIWRIGVILWKPNLKWAVICTGRPVIAALTRNHKKTQLTRLEIVQGSRPAFITGQPLDLLLPPKTLPAKVGKKAERRKKGDNENSGENLECCRIVHGARRPNRYQAKRLVGFCLACFLSA